MKSVNVLRKLQKNQRVEIDGSIYVLVNNTLCVVAYNEQGDEIFLDTFMTLEGFIQLCETMPEDDWITIVAQGGLS